MEANDRTDMKDDSRPFFHRKPGELGVYIELYDVVAQNPKAFGSNQFLLMSMKESLLAELCKADLVQLKALLERKSQWKGVILEGFEKGIILVVSFENVDSLDTLEKQSDSGKLSAVVQDILINSKVLKAVGALKMVLEAKLWSDECQRCKADILAGSFKSLKISQRGKDLQMAKRVRMYQKDLVNDILELREMEDSLNQNLGDFMLFAKKILPPNKLEIKNLKEFYSNVKMAKGTRRTGFESIDLYMKIVDKYKDMYTKLEERVNVPLLLIHPSCEKQAQKDVKGQIRKITEELSDILRADKDLKFIRFPEWESKVLPREKGLFLGLVCLIPLGLEKIVDIDHKIDEYITDFPDITVTS